MHTSSYNRLAIPTESDRKITRLESIFVIGIFFGIILMGSKFTHIGFDRLYIVEYVIILLNASLLVKIFQSESVRENFLHLSGKKLLPLVGLLVLGLFTLMLCIDKGFLAMRQSLITLYASLVFVYIFSFNSEKSLLKFLYLFLLFFTFFNSLKIFFYLYMGLTHEDEPYRVKHEEMDAIFSAIALLGILAFRNTLFSKQKFLAVTLILLNLVILFLTIKRTAFIGIFIGSAFIIFQEKLYRSISRKTLLITSLFVLCISLASVIFFREHIHNATQILVKKVNVLNENNTVWRIQAWKIALEDIGNNPIFGNGYGHRILKESLKGVDTMDPHNSYLAIAAYNGFLGLFLLIATLAISFKTYCNLLVSSQGSEQRNTVLFFTASFIFMVVYAIFNVTLEVQRLAIFYWFFVAGSFLLDRLRQKTDSRLSAKNSIVTIIRPAILLAGLIIYLVSLGLSGNYIKKIEIYLPANQGQYPEIKPAQGALAGIIKSDNSFSLGLSAEETKIYTELQWIIPNDIYAIKGREQNYYAVFDIDGNTDGVGIQFRRFDGEPIDAENLFPNSGKIVVSLAGLAKKDLKKIYGLALIVPHDTEPKELVFRQVAIAAMDFQREYPLFSRNGINQIPTLASTDFPTAPEVDNYQIKLGLQATEKIAYSSLNWRLPQFVSWEYLGKRTLVAIDFDSSESASNSFIQISNRHSYVTLENITPGSERITADLSQVNQDVFDRDNPAETLSLHLKHSNEFKSISINSIAFIDGANFYRKIPVFSGSKEGNKNPRFYTENSSARFSSRISDAGIVIDSKNTGDGWSSIYWPLPKVNLSAADLANYSLDLDIEVSIVDALHFGFTINGEYISLSGASLASNGKVSISMEKVKEKLIAASLMNNEVGLNISMPTKPHELSLLVKSIYLCRNGGK